MGKAKRTRARRAAPQKPPMPPPAANSSSEPDEEAPSADKQRGSDPRPRLTFTYNSLYDLILLLCDKEPWRAPYGETTKAWSDIAQILNDRHSLNPPATARSISKKATALRDLQENGTSPKKLRLPLTSEQHISVAAVLDKLSHKYSEWEAEKAGESSHKLKHLERQKALGARVREQALQNMSARAPAATVQAESSSHLPSSQGRGPMRSSSAPPGEPTSSTSIHALVASITSAVDHAEGVRAQRTETLLNELVRVGRDQAKAIWQVADALEAIHSTLEAIRERYVQE